VSFDAINLQRRFDVFIKLYYLKKANQKASLGRAAYLLSIHCLNNFIEYDDNKKIIKCGSGDFEKSFEYTFKSIEKSGFQREYSPIPIINGKPINGAHRVAISIYLNKRVATEEVKTQDYTNFPYDFFVERQYPQELLERVFFNMIKHLPNTYCACLFPSSEDTHNEFLKIIENECTVVLDYKKGFNRIGKTVLMEILYSGEDWLGNRKNKFNGASDKYSRCFLNKNEVRIICFQFNNNEPNIERVLKFKELYRAIARKLKHSIHITDNDDETSRLIESTLNENSMHWMNFQIIRALPKFTKKMLEFENFLIKNNVDKDAVIIVGGSVLAAYGLRDTDDIDFITMKSSSADIAMDIDYDCHNQYFADLGIDTDCYFDESYFFNFMGFRFLKVEELKRFKLKRNEYKDRVDLKLIEQLKPNNYIILSKMRLYYLIFKCYLINIKIKPTVKKILYKLKMIS